MTTTKPYTPQAGSLASQVLGFFTLNSDEHLTLDDIVDKFDYTRGNIHTLLRPAVEAGLLLRGMNEDGDYIYRRGKNAKSIDIDIEAVHRTPARGYTSPRKMLDLSTLVVEDDVPYLPAQGTSASKWEPLFAKLKKVGQSVAVPADCKAALAAAALTRAKKGLDKGKYKVAMTGPTEARVWRVA